VLTGPGEGNLLATGGEHAFRFLAATGVVRAGAARACPCLLFRPGRARGAPAMSLLGPSWRSLLTDLTACQADGRPLPARTRFARSALPPITTLPTASSGMPPGREDSLSPAEEAA
jgi:hypothetical protein